MIASCRSKSCVESRGSRLDVVPMRTDSIVTPSARRTEIENDRKVRLIGG